MRKDDFMFECLNYINTSKLQQSSKKRKIRKQKRKKISSPNVAAIGAIVLALAVGGAVPVGIGMFDDKDSGIRYEEGQEKIISHNEIQIYDKLYNMKESYVDEKYIVDLVSTISNDELGLKYEVYEIESISSDFAVAVKRDGDERYYIFNNTDYKPETFGQLIDDLSLKENLVIEEIYIREGDKETLCEGYDTEEIYNILFEKNREADVVQNLMRNKRISVISYIEKLSNIRVTFQVIEDEYIYTNMLGCEIMYRIDNMDELINKLQNN